MKNITTKKQHNKHSIKFKAKNFLRKKNALTFCPALLGIEVQDTKKKTKTTNYHIKENLRNVSESLK